MEGYIKIQIFLRILSTIFLIVATICICLGTQLCGIYKKQIYDKGEPYCQGSISIKSWTGNLTGQWFIFIGSILMILLCLGLILLALQKSPKHGMIFGLCSIAAAVIFVLYCVEAWYADYMGRPGYVESYIAAAAFYFGTVVLLIIDATIAVRKY